MRVVSLLILLGLTSGCSGAVDVSAPTDVDPATAQICGDLTDALPEQVSGQERQDTNPDSGLTAAWGDPAIVLRCGVPRPAALEPSSQLTTVNGVDWFVEELTGGYLFTTYGRRTYVEITVPADYAPEIGPVTELTTVVADTVPQRSNTPATSP